MIIFKTTWKNHTLKIMKKIPGNLFKNLEISWNFVSPKKWEPCLIILNSFLKRKADFMSAFSGYWKSIFVKKKKRETIFRQKMNDRSIKIIIWKATQKYMNTNWRLFWFVGSGIREASSLFLHGSDKVRYVPEPKKCSYLTHSCNFLNR